MPQLRGFWLETLLQRSGQLPGQRRRRTRRRRRARAGAAPRRAPLPAPGGGSAGPQGAAGGLGPGPVPGEREREWKWGRDRGLAAHCPDCGCGSGLALCGHAPGRPGLPGLRFWGCHTLCVPSSWASKATEAAVERDVHNVRTQSVPVSSERCFSSNTERAQTQHEKSSKCSRVGCSQGEM